MSDLDFEATMLKVLKEKPRSIKDLSFRLGRQLFEVCYYLGRLEERRLVDSKYEIITVPTPEKSGWAKKVYSAKT